MTETPTREVVIKCVLDLVERLRNRSRTDMLFRKALLHDPYSVLEEYDFPTDEIKIRFFENLKLDINIPKSKGQINIPLPPYEGTD